MTAPSLSPPATDRPRQRRRHPPRPGPGLTSACRLLLLAALLPLLLPPCGLQDRWMLLPLAAAVGFPAPGAKAGTGATPGNGWGAGGRPGGGDDSAGNGHGGSGGGAPKGAPAKPAYPPQRPAAISPVPAYSARLPSPPAGATPPPPPAPHSSGVQLQPPTYPGYGHGSPPPSPLAQPPPDYGLPVTLDPPPAASAYPPVPVSLPARHPPPPPSSYPPTPPPLERPSPPPPPPSQPPPPVRPASPSPSVPPSSNLIPSPDPAPSYPFPPFEPAPPPSMPPSSLPPAAPLAPPSPSRPVMVQIDGLLILAGMMNTTNPAALLTLSQEVELTGLANDSAALRSLFPAASEVRTLRWSIRVVLYMATDTSSTSINTSIAANGSQGTLPDVDVVCDDATLEGLRLRMATRWSVRVAVACAPLDATAAASNGGTTTGISRGLHSLDGVAGGVVRRRRSAQEQQQGGSAGVDCSSAAYSSINTTSGVSLPGIAVTVRIPADEPAGAEGSNNKNITSVSETNSTGTSNSSMSVSTGSNSTDNGSTTVRGSTRRLAQQEGSSNSSSNSSNSDTNNSTNISGTGSTGSTVGGYSYSIGDMVDGVYGAVVDWQEEEVARGGGVAMCAAPQRETVVSTQVRALYQVPLSLLGLEAFTSACGGGGGQVDREALLGTSGTGGGSSLQCEVKTVPSPQASTSDGQGSPVGSVPDVGNAGPGTGNSDGQQQSQSEQPRSPGSGIVTALAASIGAGGAAVLMAMAGVAVVVRKRRRQQQADAELAEDGAKALANPSFVNIPDYGFPARWSATAGAGGGGGGGPPFTVNSSAAASAEASRCHSHMLLDPSAASTSQPAMPSAATRALSLGHYDVSAPQHHRLSSGSGASSLGSTPANLYRSTSGPRFGRGSNGQSLELGHNDNQNNNTAGATATAARGRALAFYDRALVTERSPGRGVPRGAAVRGHSQAVGGVQGRDRRAPATRTRLSPSGSPMRVYAAAPLSRFTSRAGASVAMPSLVAAAAAAAGDAVGSPSSAGGSPLPAAVAARRALAAARSSGDTPASDSSPQHPATSAWAHLVAAAAAAEFTSAVSPPSNPGGIRGSPMLQLQEQPEEAEDHDTRCDDGTWSQGQDLAALPGGGGAAVMTDGAAPGKGVVAAANVSRCGSGSSGGGGTARVAVTAAIAVASGSRHSWITKRGGLLLPFRKVTISVAEVEVDAEGDAAGDGSSVGGGALTAGSSCGGDGGPGSGGGATTARNSYGGGGGPRSGGGGPMWASPSAPSHASAGSLDFFVRSPGAGQGQGHGHGPASSGRCLARPESTAASSSGGGPSRMSSVSNKIHPLPLLGREHMSSTLSPRGNQQRQEQEQRAAP